MANRYFVCTRNRRPVEFDIAQDRPVPDAEIAYFIRGFRVLERMHDFDGWTVCFAWSSTVRLPVLGERVIAVVYGDEHCRVPDYVGRVAAVMKCHGLYPTFVPRRRPLRLAQVEAAEYLRNSALWLRTGWRWAFSREVRARCHLLPIGYGIPSEPAAVPFERRRYLTSFLGSIAGVPRDQWLRRFIGTPKAFSRTRLLGALHQIEARHGAERVMVSTTTSFQDSLGREQLYADVMAETQICVAPRGTTHETWRVFDGLKAGCVVIADRLPRHPFYRDSPILQIEDWRDLPDLLDDLLRDPAALRARHEAGLRFWRDELSEDRLARRYAEALGLRGREIPGPTRAAAAKRSAAAHASLQPARRTVLAAPLLAMGAGGARAQPAHGQFQGAVAVGPTLTAAAFLDTVGVGAHWEYKDTAYGQRTERLVELLAGSGIRHVRGYEPGISERLAQRGLRATAVVGPEVGTPDQIADMVQLTNRSAKVIAAVEGPNEADLFWPKNNRLYGGKGFPEGVVAYQWDLYRALKSRRRTADVMVIGPSLGETYDPGGGRPNPFAQGSLANAVDLGNFHPYPFGGNSFSFPFPYGTIERYYWTGNFPSANLDEFPYNRLVYAPPFHPKPMAATETGYFTGPEGVTEAVHARYIPRLFAEYARLGVRRTYLYELADVDSPSTRGSKDAHFGLLRADASPKPAFTALRSLLRLVARGAEGGVEPVPPAVAIEPRMPPGYDRTGFVHSLVLQSTATEYLLLLWHEVASADTATTPPREIAVPAGVATVTLPPAMRATACYAYGPAWELRPQAIESAADRVEIPLLDSVAVLAFAKAG